MDMRRRAIHLFSATGDDQRKNEMTADFTRLGMDDLLRAIVMGPRDFDALMRVAAIAALDPR